MLETKERPKRVLIVMNNLACGGAERVGVQILNHLDANKYKIKLVLFENILDFKNELIYSSQITALNKKNRWDFFKLILRLRKVIKQYRPDVILSLIYYTNFVAVLASLLSGCNPRIIVCEHSYPREYLKRVRKGNIKRWLIKHTYKKADKIISVSNEIEHVMQKDFNIPHEKTKTIYNPISIATINDLHQQKVSHPFFKNNQTQVIIGVGRLIKSKRWDILLNSFASLRKNNEKLRLIILGKGELLDELKKLTIRLQIDQWVDFLGFKENPYAWLANADLFVLSSDYEGFPVVILEALACGIPVISTDCQSGPKEIIQDGQNGILIPPQDENALKEAILRLLGDEKLRKKLAEEGKRRAEDFDINKILPQYEELL